MRKGLQKFTDFNGKQTEFPADLENSLISIIDGKKIDLNDVYNLTEEQKETLRNILTAGIISLEGDDRDKLVENVHPILSECTRNEIWEQNHRVIMFWLDYLTRNNTVHKLPSITRLANETGMSRVTVTRHLKEYYNSEAWKEKQDQFKFLRESLLMKVYDYAHEGNMKAAKIFFDATDENQKQPKVKNQYNYTQNNNITITPEQLEQMPKKQREAILKVIKGNQAA